jgi:hypothetical protein
MRNGTGAVEALAADFTGFRRVLATVGSKELESFHSLSGQYGLFEDVDPLKQRLEALAARIDTDLKVLAGATGDAPDSLLESTARGVALLDMLLEQLSRYVTVADLRGASLTSGDLLQKLQGWIATLRDWLSGTRRQLEALTARR